ncbi:MAG: tetratricopeptide repeat protein, partial [Acidobacteria bacterium]|nr:tetratricopeptide repeat protein [Acidobacteriota bacterium]
MHVEFPRPFAEVRLRSSWFLLAAFLLSLGPAAAVAAADAVPLPPGVILERSLGAAASERFAVELDPSKAWRVRVEQEGIDVVVAAVDPLGREVLEVDGPTGREGVESLVIEPATRGSYTVEVRSEKKGVAAGRYTLRLDALSETTAEDRQRLRTEKALSEAGRLNRVGEDGGREQARAALAEAIGLWHELGEPRREAEALLALGAQLEVSGNTEAAVERYEQAVALRRQLGDRGALAGVLEALGAARLKLGRLADGRVALDEALTLRRELGPASLEATTRNQLCLVLQRAGSWTEAASCYQQALTLAKSTGDVALEARVLNNLGGIDSNRGEPTAALEHFEAALER